MPSIQSSTDASSYAEYIASRDIRDFRPNMETLLNSLSEDARRLFVSSYGVDGTSPPYTPSTPPTRVCVLCANRLPVTSFRGSESLPTCDTCRNRRVSCSSCGRTDIPSNIYDVNGGRRCFNCINPIMSYSTNVLSVKNWRPRSSTELYYGVELELSAYNGKYQPYAVKAHSLVNGFAILKSDSSVINGFEIVSVPAKPSKINSMWEPFFKGMSKGLVGYKGGCGMHVHVTRRALSEDTIKKLSVFLNDPQNLRLIELISCRHLNSYCKQNPYITFNSSVAIKAMDRYTILNTTRDDTIEFRNFKSTMKFDQFKRNIEFVTASIEFCNLQPVSSLLYTDFIKFVSNSKRYPILQKSIARWYRTDTKKSQSNPLFSATTGLPVPF